MSAARDAHRLALHSDLVGTLEVNLLADGSFEHADATGAPVGDPAFAIKLYFDIVMPCTDRPTNSYSVQTFAQRLGFLGRDPHLSGTASIQRFNEWCKDRTRQGCLASLTTTRTTAWRCGS